MSRSKYRVTEAELAVLDRLWIGGAMTIRQLMAELYPDGGTSAYATVQKLLDRLEAKSCVSRRSAGRANVFSAEVSRQEVITGRLQEVADTFFGGALSPLLSHLVSSTGLTDRDLSELRELVDRLDSQEGGS